MHSLVILGAGGNVNDIQDVVEAINACKPTWKVEGYLDDTREPGSLFCGRKVLGRLESVRQFDGCLFLVAIGSDRTHRQRPELLDRLGLRREHFATLVHPLASISSRARLGAGVCVTCGVTVAGGVVVGDHVWLGARCVLGHDAEIHEYSIVAPGAVISGLVHVGQACYIGAGSVIRGRVRIEAKALVGMGAVVVQDVDAGATVVGNPARILQRSSSGCHRGVSG